MKQTHLTDEQLQAYLLTEAQDAATTQHLSVCATCSAKLETYQQLEHALQTMPSESFAFDVTTVVMHRIEEYEQQKSSRQNVFFWGVLTCLAGLVLSLSIPFLPPVLAALNAMPVLTLLFTIGTGLVIGLFLLADSNRQYKKNAEKIIQGGYQS